MHTTVGDQRDFGFMGQFRGFSTVFAFQSWVSVYLSSRILLFRHLLCTVNFVVLSTVAYFAVNAVSRILVSFGICGTMLRVTVFF